MSKCCRVGGSGVDAFVSGAVVSGSVELGCLALSSKRLSCWWLLCQGVRVRGSGVGDCRVVAIVSKRSCWGL